MIYNNVYKKAFNFSLQVYLHGREEQKQIKVKRTKKNIWMMHLFLDYKKDTNIFRDREQKSKYLKADIKFYKVLENIYLYSSS